MGLERFIILFFLILSSLFFFGNKKSATIMIQEIDLSPKYYPKRYHFVPRWMKKFFKIKQKMIPQFIYLELLSTIFFVILGLVDIAICLCAKEKLKVFEILLAIFSSLGIIETIYSSIMFSIFKHKGSVTPKSEKDNQGTERNH